MVKTKLYIIWNINNKTYCALFVVKGLKDVGHLHDLTVRPRLVGYVKFSMHDLMLPSGQHVYKLPTTATQIWHRQPSKTCSHSVHTVFCNEIYIRIHTIHLLWAAVTSHKERERRGGGVDGWRGRIPVVGGEGGRGGAEWTAPLLIK